MAEPLSKVLVRSYFPEGCSNNDLMKRLLMGLKVGLLCLCLLPC